MKLTHPWFRESMKASLLEMSMLIGRDDQEAQTIFDNCTVDFDYIDSEEHALCYVGGTLYNADEAKAIFAAMSVLDEIGIETKHRDLIEFLQHKRYSEFAKLAKAAYDLMVEEDKAICADS